MKPWVKFGVSSSGIYRSSLDPAVGSPTSSGASQHYLSNCADTRSWLREGWGDYLASDARCGDGKVAVCHQPGQGSAGTICVAPGAVQAFIRKGETLGSCS